MRRKKLLEITLCAVLMIGALLCCMQDASARETLLISGNADLYPIESYDRGRECYVGLLPELYERLSEQTGYDLVYLPYSKNTTQAQQAENRQADIISAYPSGTVDSGAMCRQVLLCTIEHGGAERAIYVGFTNALTPELAGALSQALEDLSGAESIGVLADYMNSSGAEAYRTRWLITLAALIAAMLAAAVALIVFARKKRAEQKTNALIDPRYGIGNDGYYLNCMETLIPAPLRSIVYVFCIGCDMPSLERRFGEAEREEIFSRHEVHIEKYCKVIRIEAATLVDMVQHGILNAASEYEAALCNTIAAKRAAAPELTCHVESSLANAIGSLNEQLLEETIGLKTALETVSDDAEPETLLHYYHDEVEKRTNDVRKTVDKLEVLTASKYWPYPTFCELLFSV